MNVTNVKNNIKNIYSKKHIALYGLMLDYASIMINYFRSVQPPKPNSPGKFWYNRTGTAAARMFTNVSLTKEFVSLIMSHGVQYGTYLELANDRSCAAIYPIIQRYYSRLAQDINKLYRDG